MDMRSYQPSINAAGSWQQPRHATRCTMGGSLDREASG